MEPKSKINIIDIFKDYQYDVTPKNDGNFQTTCKSCGLQGGRTQGFIIFPDSGKENTGRAYCQSTHKNFNILETYALIHGFIDCKDGRDTGEHNIILSGDTRKQVIDHFKNNYGDEIFDELADKLGFRKEIELPDNGKLVSTFANELGNEMGNKQVIFLRPQLDGVYETAKIRHVDGTYDMEGLKEVHPTRFITMTENYFRPFANVPQKGGGTLFVIKSMRSTHASIVLVSDNFRNKLLILDRILQVPLPIIHKGKIVFPKKGYDKRFGTYLPQRSPNISKPDMPIEEAKQIIEDLFHEFCFKDDIDKAKAISAFITPFIKGLLPKFNTRCPIFVYVANRERSGKDYCAGCTGMIFEGFALEDAPVSDGEKHRTGKNDELSKKLISVLKSGRRRYHSANNKGHVDSAVLEGAATSEKMSGRELGKNNMFEIDNEIDFSLSGNQGISFTPDLINRSVFINLFLDLEDANAREFDRPNLHGWILDNRELILSALYSYVRNWFDKGRPKGSIPFASFPIWANIVGGIMEAAEYENPCKKDAEQIVTDPETIEIKRLFELCFEQYPGKYIERKTIINIIESGQNSGEDLFNYYDFEDRGNVIAFWKKFTKYVGRIFSNIKLKHDNNVKTIRRKYCFFKEFDGTKSGQSGQVGQVKPFVSRAENLYRISQQTKRTPLSVQPVQINENFEYQQPLKVIKTESTEALEPFIVFDQKNDKINKVNKEYDKMSEKSSNSIGNEGVKPKKSTKIEKPEVGTDREVQFYENSWDTRNINKECSKKDVEIFIKKKPGVKTTELLEKMGTGSLQHLNDLKAEKKVREEDYKLWI